MSEYIVKCKEFVGISGKTMKFPEYIDLNQEIVRCRDCVYNAKDADGICYRFDHEHFNQPDGFCAWGESVDEQRDSNGTCPDGNETCPNHSMGARREP